MPQLRDGLRCRVGDSTFDIWSAAVELIATHMDGRLALTWLDWVDGPYGGKNARSVSVGERRMPLAYRR